MTFSLRLIRSFPGLSVIFLIVFLTPITSSWAEPAGGREKPGTTVAVFHCDYSPVSFWNRTTNKPSGFFVDVMDSVAERSGLQVKYICKSGWQEMISAIESGEADLGVLMRSEEREKIMLFSTPIEVSYLSFFARSQSSVDTDGMTEQTVGVVKGSMSYERLKERPGLVLHIEGTYQEGIFQLLAGKIDLFAGEDSMILKSAREARLDDRIRKVGKPFAERERCLAVRKDNIQLLELLNKSLHGFVGGPEYQSIYLKWYGAPVPYWTADRILIASGIFLFITVCGMALWRYISILKINKELIRNVTQRKQAEKKTSQSEQFIRNILDTVDEGFIVIDRGYRILTANKAYCCQVSLSCDEVIGKHCYEVSHRTSRPCYEEGEECPVRHVLTMGVPYAVIHRHTDPEGRVLYVDTKGFPIKDAAGNITSVIETVNNITE